jgi:hypothetical protein
MGTGPGPHWSNLVKLEVDNAKISIFGGKITVLLNVTGTDGAVTQKIVVIDQQTGEVESQ